MYMNMYVYYMYVSIKSITSRTEIQEFFLAPLEASVVFVCESVPCILMQHLPVLCALKRVPVAVIAASPELLGTAVAPLRPGKRLQGATAPWTKGDIIEVIYEEDEQAPILTYLFAGT